MQEQFCLSTSLPNFPTRTLVKFVTLLKLFIKRTAKTSACNDIRGRIYNSIAGGIIV